MFPRLPVDITDELERIENNEEMTTTNEDRDDTEKDGEIPGIFPILKYAK